MVTTLALVFILCLSESESADLLPTVPAVTVEVAYCCAYCTRSTYGGDLLMCLLYQQYVLRRPVAMPIVPAARVSATHCCALYRQYVLRRHVSVQAARADFHGVSQRANVQDGDSRRSSKAGSTRCSSWTFSAQTSHTPTSEFRRFST